ncbi:MAG: hypothetical protein WCF38_26580, partial [Pseudolabrys sp.]
MPDKLLAAADEVIELPLLLRLLRAGYGTTRPIGTFTQTSAFDGNSGQDIGPLTRLPRGARALLRQFCRRVDAA